jgi:hypothetical protein
LDKNTLRLMERYGLDRIETLRTVLRGGQVNLKVTKKGGATGNLYIGNQLGYVHSTIIDERHFDWLEDYLSFRGPDSPDDLERFINRPVNDICPDALFSRMTLGALRSTSCRSQLSIDQPVHFVDLDQGRFWEARLAA